MTHSPSGICWQCGEALPPEKFQRSEVCEECRYDTRCCRNCRFYDAKYSRECRETEADPPAEKEKSNFCEYFTPSPPRGGEAVGGKTRPKKDSKSAFESLFNKPPPRE